MFPRILSLFGLSGAIAAAALIAGCTPIADEARLAAVPQSRGQCFRAQEVNGYKSLSERVVDVEVGGRRVFRLEMFGLCPDVNWSHRIALISRAGSWICEGVDAELIVPSTTGGTNRCPVSSIRELSQEEIQASRRTRN